MTYITMPDIGSIADVGSQIQQFFSMLALAKQNNKILVFPKKSRFIQNGLKFFDLLDIDINIIENKNLAYFNMINIDFETANLLNSRTINLDPNINYALTGSRFDLYTVWYNRIKDIVDSVNFRPSIIEYAREIITEVRDDKPIVSLHVRRGDYLLPQHSHFVKLDYEYYRQAIDKLNLSDFKLFIFSNGIEWCYENLKNLHSDIIYSVDNNYQADMAIMSLCDHNIIANSSFSWWAAYLNKNKNKKIVCPANYLQNHELASIINKNYYPKEWIAIDN